MIKENTPLIAYFVSGEELPVPGESPAYLAHAELAERETSFALIPFSVRHAYLESAMHNLRTGLFGAVMLDSYIIPASSDDYVDVKTPIAGRGWWYDFAYYDADKRLVVGDNTYSRAIRLLSEDFLGKIADPIALVWTRDEYVDTSALVAFSARLAFATVRGFERPPMCEIDIGCRVEFVDEPDQAPFDIVVDPPEDYEPPAKQLVIRTDSREFVAARLASAFCSMNRDKALDPRGIMERLLEKK